MHENSCCSCPHAPIGLTNEVPLNLIEKFTFMTNNKIQHTSMYFVALKAEFQIGLDYTMYTHHNIQIQPSTMININENECD